MGIANKVINILVLVAAIGAAVCAFLLWQKREQITKGREILSQAIIQTVDRIGPKGQIQKDAMSIKLEADQLKEPVSVLQKNIEKICKQRDEIAKAFADVVNSVNSLSSSLEKKAQLEEAELADYEKYGAKCEESVALVTERVNYYKQRSDIIKKNLKDLSSALEVAGISDANFWDNAKLNAGLSGQVKRAREFSTRFHKYSAHILTSTDKLRAAIGEEGVNLKKPGLGLDNQNWRKELDTNLEGVTALAKKIVELREAVKTLKAENESLKKQLSEKEALLKKKDSEIASLNKSIAEAKTEIKRLKKIIDPNSDDGEGGEAAESAATAQTDLTMIKKLVGKITYVNPTYGFVAIDLGTKSTVEGVGVDGKMPIRKNVPLPQNAIMTVATSLNPADAEYVARIAVARVGTDSSIANVLPLPGSSSPKVGDIVFFSDSDLRQMREIRELELKQAEEAAAREKVKEATAIIEKGGKTDAKKAGDSSDDTDDESEEDKEDEE